MKRLFYKILIKLPTPILKILIRWYQYSQKCEEKQKKITQKPKKEQQKKKKFTYKPNWYIDFNDL